MDSWLLICCQRIFEKIKKQIAYFSKMDYDKIRTKNVYGPYGQGRNHEMKATTRCTRPQYVCGNEKIKLIGGIDGYFPDFGHHLENEMGGLWLYPIKILDGFWMRFIDHTAKTVDCYMKADEFENFPHKNVFHYYGGGLGHTTVEASRIQLAPEGIKGILVKYIFHNKGVEVCDCTTELLARVHMVPVWLSEELGICAGERVSLTYQDSDNCFLAKDCANPWYALIGCNTPWDDCRTGDFFGPEITVGPGISCAMTHNFTLAPGETKEICFYVAGSELSEEDARNQYRMLLLDKDYESEKIEKYDNIRKTAQLTVEDKRFQEIYQWAKVNTDWLILDQETCGRGIMAGIPEYCWWFGCDSFYTLQGILAIGNEKLCRDTLKLVKDYSEKINGNGRIIHEILPNGYCPNPGNTQETAHFVTMVWKYFEWTGDREFLEECLPYIDKSIVWLKEQDDDGDLYPSGYGITEIAGLNMEMIDTIVYTCEAYECYAKMMALMGKQEASERYLALYEQMKEKINRELWDEENGLYCDAYASYAIIEEKREVIEGMLASSRSDEMKAYILRILEERKIDGTRERGWLLNRNWPICTPMEVGIADTDKAMRALGIMEGPDYIGEYGMYLSAMYRGAQMTISTGVMAVSQAMYGRVDEALRLIEKMFSTFGMATPGSMSEMSPDYGCFVQAWTAYSAFLPVVQFFFGIEPRASESRILVHPCMPGKWKNASLTDVPVLNGTLSVTVADGILTIDNRTSYPVDVCEGMTECHPGQSITVKLP